MMPVTYYPIPTQDLFRSNAERIKGKPYAKYFNGDLWLHDEVLPQLKKPMDEADILPKSTSTRFWTPGTTGSRRASAPPRTTTRT
ncbi:hypothetical protein [Nonomuraea antri]|uniref:hypothetical protein n=1 Tax=Nonomuraea antri TaxID=2730852 RepID=UPI001C2C02FA|nr:hypothetical protein [Nonomuraea antri]